MIYAEVVYKNDEFEYEMGLEPKLKHVPDLFSKKFDHEIKFVYAVAHYTDGGYNFVVLTREQVEDLRLRSPMQKGTPTGAWKTDYAAMSKAKAIKQLAKWIPLSDEEQILIESDEQIITPDKLSSEGKGVLPEFLDNGSLYYEVLKDRGF